jgi:hypothetical protein
MEKELQRIENCSSGISKLLQRHYELDEYTADTYALLFLEQNFKKLNPSKWDNFWVKGSKFVTYVTTDSNRYPYHSPLKNLVNRVLMTLFIGVIICVVALGIYEIVINRPLPTYKTAVSDTFHFDTPNDRFSNPFNEQGIYITIKEGDAFNQVAQTLTDGETVQMRTSQGILLNVTKKNHQLWLERVEEK